MRATRKLALLRSEMTARSIQKAVASLFIPQREGNLWFANPVRDSGTAEGLRPIP